jgi:hypothetical protein
MIIKSLFNVADLIFLPNRQHLSNYQLLLLSKNLIFIDFFFVQKYLKFTILQNFKTYLVFKI